MTARSIQNVVKKYVNAAGLDPKSLSADKLRHTAATLMYKYGRVDIRSLQQILGNESVATTEIYTHVDEHQLQSAVNSNPLATMFN
jgi:integrase/recombinase XerD